MTTKSRAQQWFEELLRFDTSNPPGNEKPAIEWIARLLAEHGISSQVIEPEPGRANLVAALPGAAEQAALLLSSHIDVVPVEDASYWKFPPFSASEYDSMLWSRGALDMKFKTAFDLEFLIRSKGKRLNRPVKLAVVADEEQGSMLGSRYLLEHHRELIEAEYAINELGGFNVHFGSVAPFLVQAGEKGQVHIRIHVSGESGHASTPAPHGAVGLLTRIISALEDLYLGYSLCRTTERFLDELASACEGPEQDLYRALASVEHVEQALNGFSNRELRAQVRAMLCNTLAPTRIGGGFQLNVIPSTAWCDLDCRIIPGVSSTGFVEQLQLFIREVLGQVGVGELTKNVQIEVISAHDGYELPPDDPLLKHLCAETKLRLGRGSSKAPAIPYLLPASSDNSHYMRAGIKPIGFSPLNFPNKFQGFSLAHNTNERIPLKSFEDGLDCYSEALSNFVLR